MPRNLLAHETSPYLLQHRDNPVAWHPWCPEAFEIARREDKPVLLSVGYAACHWCHVMAHESFEDAQVAELMNRLFVNVKLDREERPDLDSLYQTALALMGEAGGWPLTMFLTPEADPFWGGTYFPPTPRYGRPAFPDVLRSVAHAFRVRRPDVLRSSQVMRDALGQLGQPARGPELTRDLVDEAATAALRLVDPIHGGTEGAPKFPQPSLFRFLWQTARRRGNRLFRDAVAVTLDRMAQGGIYDHLGGGFARYATDDIWLVPHFEKMLYDNAQLLDLMAEVWKETRSPLYATRCAEIVDWALRDMTVVDGEAFAFAGALDADSEGREGKYYVWTEAEIDAALGADSPVFKASYDVSVRGNWEGTTILNRSRDRSFGIPPVEAHLAEARRRLLEIRDRRVPPLRDDKVLADWNGLMIAALANAGGIFDRPAWIEMACQVFSFVCSRLVAGGRLHHSWCAGRPGPVAMLDDQAQMIRAALALHQATGETVYLEQARAWAAEADRLFADPEGGYFLAAADVTDVIARTKPMADTACPSGGAVMAEVLLRLHHLTGEACYLERARPLFTLFGDATAAQMLNQPTLLAAFDLLDDPLRIVVAGPVDDPAAQALWRTAVECAPPAAVLMRGAGAPGAGVCTGQVCEPSITDPALLRHRLAARWPRVND
ncbi:MAG: thioredoxin domain-containing protein [Magnetospirillum sp. WYHS-4]